MKKFAYVLIFAMLMGIMPARAADAPMVTAMMNFFVPQMQLDLRGYELCQFEMQEWFLERINEQREAYGLHPYELYTPAVLTSIEHSMDLRDNDMSGNRSSDGRTHQQRHDRWMGLDRTKVTSAHSSSHWVTEGEFTRADARNIANRILSNEGTFSFLMNPTYYYIGIGFSIQENGRGRLSITMATRDGERAAHRARTAAQRTAHREAYLQAVREARGWEQ